MKRKIGSDWLTQKTKINEGASIGASAVIVSPKVVGRWAMVGAGAIVTKDVPDFALVVGNPARQIGWVGKNGLKLQSTGQDVYVCPISGEKFFLENFIMRELL
jgi:serine acetyltransferase